METENINDIPEEELRRRLRLLLLALIQSAPCRLSNEADADRWQVWRCHATNLLEIVCPTDPEWQDTALEATDAYLDRTDLKPTTLKFFRHLAYAVRRLDDPDLQIDRHEVAVSYSPEAFQYLGTITETDIPGVFAGKPQPQPA